MGGGKHNQEAGALGSRVAAAVNQATFNSRRTMVTAPCFRAGRGLPWLTVTLGASQHAGDIAESDIEDH